MESQNWNSIISKLPNPHFLQTYEWGQVKAKYGWSPLYAVWDADGKWRVESDPNLLSTFHSPVAACLILKRQILRNGFAARLSILYLPKGPLLDWTNESLRTRVLNDLQSFAKKQGAIFLKCDPDVVLGTGVPRSAEDAEEKSGAVITSELKRRGWEYASDQIQFKNTVVIDLNPTEDELLARMKQKTRYNIRLAEKKGVSLRVGKLEDLPMLYKMYAETSVRDGFVIRDEAYYKTAWELFMKNQSPVSSLQPPITNYQLPHTEPLIAEVNNQPVAAIFVFYFAGRAYYVYGMSRDAHREKMPTYLLQWEAMKRAKARGCTDYDLWGAPDVFDESDSMWGVYRFKEGLGGKVVRTLGAWDFAPNPFWYRMYSDIMPRVLDVMRSRGRSKTKQSLGA
ncbi:MAG TPA: peptidoglycan bridge formation glycyltransferase FemA/FemB family protein [Anaerolineales bacterium]|nr:peptidoglycan bridge formation glycyltransferase FemA/FemB family protein [Anaerolineales bacterium]HNQ93595.1 peptidoglycan bridge formation glycyltransferase FemA/FemB family protein [Anaerolineales bacterium]HNS62208.1 peptidoglycan bridge formation glycyltransferase FemA/FemB family protein [Anaerolineales bacterium]